MAERIADTLVLAFTSGVSLHDWKTTGMLDREWALYERLGPYYAQIILVTYGSEDAAHAVELGPSVKLVCNDQKLTRAAYAATIPDRVAALCADSRSIVVKTNQLASGVVAVRITERLRAEREKRVALIARGGYLWSRFVAREQGANSTAALDAGVVERELCKAADLIVGTTREMIEDLEWRYGLDDSGTRLVPNYVITDVPFRESSERQAGLVLYAGQLAVRKRVDLLIESIANLPENLREQVTFRVIGTGPEEARLKHLATAKGIKAEFLPRIAHRELLEHMSRCAIYAQASELEGHPKTVLEAMATGASVVVAESPGLGNVVQNGVTGLRVTGEADAFTHAIGALLSDDDWRSILGSAASRIVRENLGLDVIISQEIAAHRAALQRASHSRHEPVASVRWEPDLLRAPSDLAAGTWQRSLEAYLSRLSPEQRREFLERFKPAA